MNKRKIIIRIMIIIFGCLILISLYKLFPIFYQLTLENDGNIIMFLPVFIIIIVGLGIIILSILPNPLKSKSL